MFTIHMGIPEMKAFWDELRAKNNSGKATKIEIAEYKKIGKALPIRRSLYLLWKKASKKKTSRKTIKEKTRKGARKKRR